MNRCLGGTAVPPQILEDAVYAWKTGEFEGVSVFHTEDPGTPVGVPHQSSEKIPDEDADANAREEQPEAGQGAGQDPGRAAIRIDLSHWWSVIALNVVSPCKTVLGEAEFSFELKARN